MTKMMAVQVPKPGADFEVVERDIPEPGPGMCKFDLGRDNSLFLQLLKSNRGEIK